MPPAFTLVLLSTLAAAPALEPGTLLSYRGSVAPLRRDGTAEDAQKQFDLRLLVARHDAQGTLFYWLLDEQGRGSWPWTDRFGKWDVNVAGETIAGTVAPALLYDRGEGTSVLPIVAPLLTVPAGVAEGGTWGESPNVYEFHGQVDRGGQPVREVLLKNTYGRKRQAWLAADGPLVVELQEKVFMGQGEEHELRLQLVGDESLGEPQTAAAIKTVDELLALKGELKVAARNEEPHWDADQLGLLAERLPALTEQAGPTFLAGLLKSATIDAESQAVRVDEVATLAAELLGQPVAEFRVDGLGHAGLTDKELRGQVTVLHFWDYRDEPLKEPYGQTGYLDFLHEQRRAAGVKVYGVAVNSRLDDAEQRGAAVRSVRRLQTFMNLGYPLLLDGGSLLRQFGDPRRVGAALPLFVVIGRDGKIAHYHAGQYDVDRDQGLKELDAAVGVALKAAVAE